MKKNVTPEQKKLDAMLCCIQIEMRTPSTFFQNTIGPLKRKKAENWLKESGFVQHRPNLWLQKVEIIMDFVGAKDIKLVGAEAWVHLLHKPEEVNLRKI